MFDVRYNEADYTSKLNSSFFARLSSSTESYLMMLRAVETVSHPVSCERDCDKSSGSESIDLELEIEFIFWSVVEIVGVSMVCYWQIGSFGKERNQRLLFQNDAEQGCRGGGCGTFQGDLQVRVGPTHGWYAQHQFQFSVQDQSTIETH